MPVLRLIKRHLPTSSIYWWVDARFAGLFEEDPDLAGLIRFYRNGWNRPGRWIQFWTDIAWIRNQRFDWVIDLQCLARSGAVAWLANGALTVGLDEPREGARCLYDIVIRRNRLSPHAVDWYMDVLPALGVPRRSFTWIPTKPAAAASIRAKWPVDSRRWIIIQPGARWATKCWPIDYYEELVRQLARRHKDLSFAILGAEKESQIASQIAASAPSQCLNLAGSLNLQEMIEWIRASELMIGNDTGPIHAAAAMGKPVIAIFGPTNPDRTGPYGQRERVLRAQLPCSPCMRDKCGNPRLLECLKAVTPNAVANAADRVLTGLVRPEMRLATSVEQSTVLP